MNMFMIRMCKLMHNMMRIYISIMNSKRIIILLFKLVSIRIMIYTRNNKCI